VSVHADDEFSLRIALEGELDDVVPADGLAGVVIARYRRTRRRRVAGAVGVVVVAAGIGVPLGMSGPSGKPTHTPGGAPERSTPRQHTGAVPLIGRYADHLAISASSLSPAALVSLTPANSFAVAA
jgi:hypothetical protein